MKISLSVFGFTLALFAAAAYAQESRATITGSVTDPQGAAVPAARVEAKNVDTNVVYPTVTTGAGVYTIPLLPPGVYSVTAAHDGFERATQEKVEIRTGERVQADFKLQVGAMSQEVSVVSEAPLLETATGSRGQVISSEAIEDTPVMGRNISMLATLAAGVQIPTGRADIQNVYDGAVDGLVINGGRTGRNNFTINGLPDVAQEGATTNSTASAIPPPEATSEVRVQTSEYAAEYGHTGGGTIDVTIKSGTNKVHGNAYEYWRNDDLNANLFQQNANNIPRTIFKWNQPGTELDGPVYIPHLYDGRNKTFFLFSWEKHLNTLPLPTTSTVPTAQQRGGDFSGTTANGNPVIIYDPLNLVNGVRQPFSGNLIPASRINPIGANLVSIMPNPTSTGDNDHNNNFVLAPYPDHQRYDVFSNQVDQNLNAKNRLTVTVIRSNRHEIRDTTAYTPVQSSPDYIHWRINHNSSVSWTNTLNPTTVINARIGYNRRQFAIQPYSQGYDVTKLGFPASLNAELPTSFFPNISETGYLPLGRASGSYSYSNDYIAQGSITKIVNRHTFKAGAQIEDMRDNYSSPAAINFSFSPVFTQKNALAANANQGNAIASLLLGYPASGGVPYNVAPAYGNRYYATYVQDDWRVSSRLTINLGLRWDLETPRTERYNRQNVGFNPTIQSPLQVPGYSLTGGLLFASSNHRYPFGVDKNNFQPRFGAAYRLDDKTVMRGGFAIFYLPAVGDSGGNNGFSTTTQFVASNDGNVTPAGSLSNPFPTGILAPPGASLGAATFLGQAFTYGDPNRVIPHVNQFSFGVQRLLPWALRLDVSYAGSRTYELEVSRNINALSLANLNLGAVALNASVPNPFAGLLPGTTLNGATTTEQQLLLPFPQFGAITENNQSLGYTWYNSLQLNLEKRFSSGLFLVFSGTLSRNMEAVSYLNPENTHLDRELTADDSPFRMRVSGGYRIPGFRNGNALVRGVLSGWQITTLVTVQKGTPVSAPTGAFSTGVNPAVSDPDAALYFNHCYINLSGVHQNCSSASQPAAWIQQPQFTLNTLSTRMPNIRTIVPPNVDFSLSKTIHLHERLNLQVRGEAFNLTNTAAFGAPNTTITSAQFGTQTLTQANDGRMIQIGLRLLF